MNTERAIFLQAIDIPSKSDRADFVVNACGADSDLKRSVSRLLLAHELPGNPLDAPVAMIEATRHAGAADAALRTGIFETVGSTIGPYRLMEQIGEGGFGLVFVAEQKAPIRRKVALKIIKPGMDSRDIVARFEAERQALALMDHTNIASVLDAGTTDTGRPYFVMELVRGIPFTKHCDQQKLDVADRLELMVDLCHAIHHAHQKGVIHRDIKPSNVMVTMLDGEPIVKVIDFGVAKAIDQNLTDKTIYTRFSAIIGTPRYMSPEQAQMSSVDVDTRTDIYGLGVLLYELLTGTTPFEKDRFESIGLDEMRRILIDEDPPKPSTRLTTCNEALSTCADDRNSPAPHLLTSAIRGDLDWIAMKALDKDRRRRYESASAMAEDIRRYLNGRPINARPPSNYYLFQKFISRNRIVVSAGITVLAVLILATVVSLWQANKAINERNQKDIALANAVRLQREADGTREKIENFSESLRLATRLVTSGRAHADARRWAAAYSDFSAAIATQPGHYNAWNERAALSVRLGLWERAATDYANSLEVGIPMNNPANWGVPQLFLYIDDKQNYRRFCNELLKTNQTKPSLPMVRCCVMSDGLAIRPERLVELAEEFLPEDVGQQSVKSGERRTRSSKYYPLGAKFYVAGLANYHAGNLEQAIKHLEIALEDKRWPASPAVLPALALAYEAHGESAKAKEILKATKKQNDVWLAQATATSDRISIPWFDWIEFQVLYRKAALKIDGQVLEKDSRIQELHQRAIDKIQTDEKR